MTAENLSIRNVEPVDRHLEKFNLGAGIDCNVAECDGGVDLAFVETGYVAGFGIVDEFYDAAVSGADPIETRAGFASLLDRIEGNGVRTVIVEDASRFARELMAQELGITLLMAEVRLLTASGDDLTASDDPTRKMMRQDAGAFAEYRRPVWSPSFATPASGNARNAESAEAGNTPSFEQTSWPKQTPLSPSRRGEWSTTN